MSQTGWTDDPFGAMPKGFRGPWCVSCCHPRLDLDITRSAPEVGHPPCPFCEDTEVEWND